MVFIGYLAAMAYLFIRISRCGDYFGFVLANHRVPLIVLSIAVLAALFSGRFMNVLLSKMGLRFVALTFLFLLSSAFSLWPGGSVHEFRMFWPASLLMFLVVASFLTTEKGLQAALNSLGFGVGLVAAYTLAFGGVSEQGRMNAGGGMAYSNANDLALVLVIGAPALMYIIGDKSRGFLQRMIAVPLLLCVVRLLVGTGSRGGMLGFVAVITFILLYQSWGVRIRVIAGVGVLAAIGVAASPGATIKRFTTIFEPTARADQKLSSRGDGTEDGEDYTGIAAASAQGRWYLKKQAAELLLRNPVFGVGFGMFMLGENDLAKEEGAARGSWKGAHDMYLQVGSENGVLALYLFITILGASWKSYRYHRNAPPNPTQEQLGLQRVAFALSASMLGFMVSGAFLTVAYDYFLCMYAAFAVGFDNVMALAAQRKHSDQAPDGALSPIQASRGQIDWTQAPVSVPLSEGAGQRA